ncbi:MAG: hypothetical protein ACLTW9_17250 [Enterocloster sp.]
MDFPKYLYHYTNLSSLCSILKSGMIRFNPLTKMDDMDEAEIRDFKNFAKYVFVSSWTSDSRESITVLEYVYKRYVGYSIAA